ncbi:hypothetical protein [Natrinema altunense]|uniref:Uncharacterized protein n=1 Tax=Natrinema altunense (strain JCM 12890 / CGMCC 1.3731 / AJ2) TaxID=1227494 RepID=L9ZKS8_NATA2|nr:hypothetical protein [Natrinema altunense]ELY85788.1 hypothetical protein C485_11323 [Natrinema altunense JCM 12890]
MPDGEIAAQQNRLLKLADRDDAERWAYETTRNLAHIQSGLGNAELDALCEVPSGIVETDSVSRGGVPLSFEVSTNDDESVGTPIHLSAEQAEALPSTPGQTSVIAQIRTAKQRSEKPER